MDRITDAYYAVVDFAADHKAWAGAIAGAFVLVVILLVISLSSSSPTTSATSVPSATSGPCQQAITNLKDFTLAHPASAGQLAASDHQTYQNLTVSVAHDCPPATTSQVANNIAAPWLKTFPTTTPTT